MENKIRLSPKRILNKEFSIETKGYSANEVDSYLDIVKEDYLNFQSMLNESYDEIESLQKENAALRRKLNELLRERQDQRDNAHVMEESLNNNVDVLRRISQLEREVYHKNKDQSVSARTDRWKQRKVRAATI